MIKKLRSKINSFRVKYRFGKIEENPIQEFFLDKLSNVLSWYLGLKKDICNFFYWGWKLRNDRNWDHHYFEYILYLKLKKMYEYFNASNIAVWTSDRTSEDYDPTEAKAMKALRICYKISERIIEDSYGRYEKKLTELYGESKMVITPIEGTRYSSLEVVRAKEDCSNKEEIENLSKYYRDREQSVRARDRRNLFKLLETYVEYWWN